MPIIVLIVLIVLVFPACEQTFNLTSPNPTAPSPSNITVTNTNTNINDHTGSDTGTVPTNPSPNPTDPNAVIPLPAYGEDIVKAVAKANPTLLANSCQDKYGEAAWQFLDLAIRTLQVSESRWGYLCKDTACTIFSKDVVAYKAGNTDKGIWIVDVIGNHCPGPNDTVTATWQILPFETERRWASHR